MRVFAQWAKCDHRVSLKRFTRYRARLLMNYKMLLILSLIAFSNPLVAETPSSPGVEADTWMAADIQEPPRMPYWELSEVPTDRTSNQPMEAVPLSARLQTQGLSAVTVEVGLGFVELTVTELPTNAPVAGSLTYKEYTDILTWRPEAGVLKPNTTYNVQYFFNNEQLGYQYGDYSETDILGSFRITTGDAEIPPILDGQSAALNMELNDLATTRWSCCPSGYLYCGPNAPCDSCFEHDITAVEATAFLYVSADPALQPFLNYNISFREPPRAGLLALPQGTSSGAPVVDFSQAYDTNPLPDEICAYAVIYDALHDQTFELSACQSTFGRSVETLDEETIEVMCDREENWGITAEESDVFDAGNGGPDTSNPNNNTRPDDGTVSSGDNCACTSVQKNTGAAAGSSALALLAMLCGNVVMLRRRKRPDHENR